MISILFIIIKIGIFQYINSLDLNLKNPHAFSLSNGNVFILHEDGVNVYNHDFTICLHSYDFYGIKLIPNNIANKYISIIQCSDSNQYLIAFVYKKIYIFSSQGQYLFNIQNLDSYFPDFLSVEPIYEKISFLYYNNQDNVYQLFLSYTNNEAKMKIIKFGINMNNKSFELLKNFIYNVESITSSNCQLMIDINSTNILSCFYAKSQEDVMYAILFDIEDNLKQFSDDIIHSGEILIPVDLIESLVSKDKGKAFITYVYSARSAYLIFDVNEKNFISSNHLIDCDNDKLIYINYFIYKEIYLFSCKRKEIIYILNFLNIENIEFSTSSIKCEKCSNITNYQLAFLPYKNEFILVESSLCNETNSNIYNNIYLYTLNYEQPSNSPDSEFLYTPSSHFSSILIKNNEVLNTNEALYPDYQSIISTNIESTFLTTSIQKNIPSTFLISTDFKFLITSSMKMDTSTPITTNLNAQTTNQYSLSTSSLSKPSSNVLESSSESKSTIISVPTIFSTLPSKISTSIPSSFSLKTYTSIPFTSNIRKDTSIPFISTFKIDTSAPFTTTLKKDTSFPFTSNSKVDSTFPLKIESSNPLKIQTTVFPISQPKLISTIPKVIDSTILFKSNDIQINFTSPSLGIINGYSPKIIPEIQCPIIVFI